MSHCFSGSLHQKASSSSAELNSFVYLVQLRRESTAHMPEVSFNAFFLSSGDVLAE